MQASPLVRMRLFLGEAPVQGVAVTQAGDLGRTGLAQRRQQGASVGVQRPQHHIAPPALDAQAAGKDRHATPRSLAVHVEAVEQHPVGAGHAPDRQRLRHQRAVLQTFFQSIANPAHEPPPRAHGRLACATLARNGMFIIDNPLSPNCDRCRRRRSPQWMSRLSPEAAPGGENLQHPAHAPQVQFAGQEVDALPTPGAVQLLAQFVEDSPMDWRQSNRRHRRRHSV